MSDGTKLRGLDEITARPASQADELEELKHRLFLAPDNADLRLRLAESLAKRGRTQEALEELRVLIGLDPNHLVARKLREQLMRWDPDNPPKDSTGAPPSGGTLH
jgi:thioredoxin-like negative regulator of GroEL